MQRKLNILFIAQDSLKKELGGPKVVMELGEAISKLGHQVTVIDPIIIAEHLRKESIKVSNIWAENVKEYLLSIPEQYDIIDVDANFLYPLIRENKDKTLIVARSVLLIPHLEDIKFPRRRTIKSIASELFRMILFGNPQKTKIARFYLSLDQADIISVSNHKDVLKLIQKGYPKDKIVNLPFGIEKKKKEAFHRIANEPRCSNKVAFIGTFDFRKGCIDIPKIFANVKEHIPDADLTLFGAKGLFQTEKKIYSFFPKYLRESVSVKLSFREEELPELLKKYKVGMFPSYLEGFGFSVIELCSAGIPVIAYDAPGPSSILSPEYLVSSGDWKSMAEKLIFYLRNEKKWSTAHREMIQLSEKYDWKLIGEQTVEIYSKKLKEKVNSEYASEYSNLKW
ncbi:glycosyltransferase family 4 protein [Catalinimonas sp. 4WD22]|uniref:glycosyltransferase family 4 protein n=1 Tax=Catalinimonas locisalis TaxID=3133978 RepID=UPI003101024B